MAKALFFVLACALIVAALAEFEMDDETLTDIELMKRDADMLEYFEAEKRGMGKNLRKYKHCQQFGMSCWCAKRTGKIVFCNGAAGGENI